MKGRPISPLTRLRRERAAYRAEREALEKGHAQELADLGEFHRKRLVLAYQVTRKALELGENGGARALGRRLVNNNESRVSRAEYLLLTKDLMGALRDPGAVRFFSPDGGNFGSGASQEFICVRLEATASEPVLQFGITMDTRKEDPE